LSGLELLAQRAEYRAADARQHAAQARDQACRDAERGDDRAERLRLGEADAHERAARVTEATAALYRHRVRYLQTQQP
jgi:hypothetical protein